MRLENQQNVPQKTGVERKIQKFNPTTQRPTTMGEGAVYNVMIYSMDQWSTLTVFQSLSIQHSDEEQMAISPHLFCSPLKCCLFKPMLTSQSYSICPIDQKRTLYLFLKQHLLHFYCIGTYVCFFLQTRAIQGDMSYFILWCAQLRIAGSRV